MVTTYRIAEVAARSGFAATTLRYYDDIGLVPATERSESGYRLYDDRALERLAFIDRVKALGCSLEEITDLVSAWDGGICGPLPHRLRDAVDDKLADARQQRADLAALTEDLQRTAASLAGPTPDGRCDDSCGCATPSATVTPRTSVTLTTGSGETTDAAPIACTLDNATDLRERIDDWQAVLRHVTGRTAIDGGLRLTFDPDVALDEVAQLADTEQGCCVLLLRAHHRGARRGTRGASSGRGRSDARTGLRETGLTRRRDAPMMLGLGAAVCIVCCAPLVLTLLGGLTIAGVAGTAFFGVVGLIVAGLAATAWLVVRRRRRTSTTTPPESVALPAPTAVVATARSTEASGQRAV